MTCHSPVEAFSTPAPMYLFLHHFYCSRSRRCWPSYWSHSPSPPSKGQRALVFAGILMECRINSWLPGSDDGWREFLCFADFWLWAWLSLLGSIWLLLVCWLNTSIIHIHWFPRVFPHFTSHRIPSRHPRDGFTGSKLISMLCLSEDFSNTISQTTTMNLRLYPLHAHVSAVQGTSHSSLCYVLFKGHADGPPLLEQQMTNHNLPCHHIHLSRNYHDHENKKTV